jgi:hypothetical protein
MCDQGTCVPVKAACLPDGTPFNIFNPGQFTDPDTRLVVSYSSKAAYVSVTEESGANDEFWVRSIDPAGKLSGITKCLAETTKTKMVSGRATETEFVLQGYQYPANAAITEFSFPLDPNTGELVGTCMNMPMPSRSDCVSKTQNVEFTRFGNATKYATHCEDPVDPTMWHLTTGGSDDPAHIEVASGPSTDYSLRPAAITYVNNERVIFVGPKIYGDIAYRRATNGYTLQPIDLSNDPMRQEAFISSVSNAAGESYILMASALLPPQFDAVIMGGLLTDFAQFSAVPPTGMKVFAHFSGTDVAKLGTYGQAGEDAISYYVGVAPLSSKSVDIYWISKTGESLVTGQSVYSVPSGDPTTIPRVAFVPVGPFSRLVVWREENAGVLTVRGQRLVCSYSN